MSNQLDIQVVQKEAFQLVGLKWEGTFEQAGAGEIRQVMHQLREKGKQVSNVIDPTTILGVSQHMTAGSFTYTVGFEVEQADHLSEGMSLVAVPSQLYAAAKHPTGEEVFRSYQRMYEWIKEQNYRHDDQQFAHLELYPISYNPLTDEPELTIMIPIRKE